MKKVLTVTIDGIRYHASRPADCRHYKRAKPCVLVPCYKDLMTPLEKRGDAK